LTYLLRDEFKRLYKKLLKNSLLVDKGYLRQEVIENLLAEHLSKKIDHGNRLWLLCNAEVWYRMYIENQSREQLKCCLLA